MSEIHGGNGDYHVYFAPFFTAIGISFHTVPAQTEQTSYLKVTDHDRTRLKAAYSKYSYVVADWVTRLDLLEFGLSNVPHPAVVRLFRRWLGVEVLRDRHSVEALKTEICMAAESAELQWR